MFTLHRQQVGLIILILWLAFGLRLYNIDAQSIWWDEGHSIFVASHPLAQIPTLPAMDVHPPAYFALLRLWTALAGSSEFALRYLSVLFSLITVALIWRFGASLSGRWSYTPMLAALFAAISPLYVAYAQEVRSYTMITFLALVSTYLLWVVVRGQGAGGRGQGAGGRGQGAGVSRQPSAVSRQGLIVGGYILATATCLYTHYFTIFLLLFQNIVWLIWVILPRHSSRVTRHLSPVPRHSSTIRKFKLWLLTQLGILLLFTPQLLLATRQITSYTNPNLIPPTLGHFISQSWQAYTVGLTIAPTPGRWTSWTIAAILVITWLLVLILKKRTPHPKPSSFLLPPSSFLLAWLLIPLTAYYLVLQRQPSFEPRYLMLVSPAIFLLLALGLNDFGFKIYDLRLSKTSPPPTPRITHYALRFTFYALTLATIAILLTGLRSYYTDDTFFKDDSAGVARWLAQETTPNDMVYIDVPHPFHYYNSRLNLPAPARYLFVDIHTAADTLNHETAGRDRLFWITWRGSDTDPRGVIQFLAQKTGQPAGQLDFKGYHVEWFDLPPDAEFSLPTELTPANATFGDVVRLDGLAFGDTASPTEPVWSTLHFTLLHPTAVNYKVSLRLRDAGGQVVAQIDRDLLNDRHFRTSAWPLDDPALNQAINVYLLPLPPDTLPGAYQLEAVLYNTEPPYPSEGVTGHSSPDGVSATIGTITVVP